jgi:SAM-dependent methyltransferase
MKLRQSGMPEESYWETLFDPGSILRSLHIGKQLRNVAELGCGYGTFSLPVASAISGTLTAFDIEAAMVERTRARAKERGIANLRCEQRDVFQHGFDVDPQSQDACLLFNILHCEDPVRVLRQAAGIVAEQGTVLVIHWRHDPSTPRGPSLDIRPRPEDCARWARKAGLWPVDIGIVDLPPYHYGLILKKRKNAVRRASLEASLRSLQRKRG